ncbi:MAG: ATP-dependent Clp protease adapter ClpS [Candidatus Riflebacteria bacterium]|nr:ATP-dependent Clp protease adapter ClpS [Candidatus Riflebacteria bacterium]
MTQPAFTPIEETIQKTRQKSKKPPMFKVFLLNDDYTTMEFVVMILEEIFDLPAAEAVRIMLHVHKNGRGLAGVYTRDIAETKVKRTHDVARKQGYPLTCTIEKE